VYFKKSSGREGFARWAEANGFTVERLYATRIRFRRQYVVEISSITTADLPTISAMTRQLSKAAGDHGGDYDGWESPIIDGADSQPQG
jgi:hypothetical protein